MIRRALLAALTLVSAVLGSTLIASGAAGASSLPPAVGHVSCAQQDSATHALLIRGYAFDTLHPTVSIHVDIWVDGHRVAYLPTTRMRSDINATYHLSGPHAFSLLVPHSTVAHEVHLVAHTVGVKSAYILVAERAVGQAPPSRFVVPWATKYVNVSPYSYGGSSPSGFDCSGFSMYLYGRAGMRSLPHSADEQLHSYRMHQISRSDARPGDLVFYLSGGWAYHVAVYAGNGKQYAAVQPGQNITYQSTPSGVVFATNWH